MSRDAPPGYASGAPRETTPIGGASSWAFATAALVLLAGYELVRSLPELYTDGAVRLTAELGGLAAATAGFALCRRARDPTRLLPSALGATALLAAGGAALAFLAFPAGAWLGRAVVAIAWLGGLSAGAGAGALVFGVGRVLADLGAVVWLIHPLRAVLCAGAWLAFSSTFPLLGALRRGALLGALLAVLAVLFTRLAPFLGVPSPLGRRALALPALAGLTAATVLSLARARVPLADVARYGDVAFVSAGPRGHHVVTRVQDGFSLFTEGLLVTTANDARRSAEALAHPALSSARRRSLALVLGSTTGSLEREVLRWSGVERLVSVATDARLSALAASSTWLAPLGAGALTDGRVERVEAEAMAFVTRDPRRYDVVLADLGDPSSYRDGKHFTLFFFERLRARLAPGGVLALPITSPLRTPATHAGIVHTLRAAGLDVALYRAPLPTLGEWGFALATADTAASEARAAALRAPGFPAGTSFVTPSTLPGLFALPAGAALADAPVSRLYDQPVVEAYEREEQALVE